jgi:hypothetical protein
LDTRNLTFKARTARIACGNRKALPAIMRHSSTSINLYEWSSSHRQHTIVTVSLAGGVCGNRVLGGPCNSALGQCGFALGVRGAADRDYRLRLERRCNATPGVGIDYWRGLFEAVKARRGDELTNSPEPSDVLRPDAIVLNYGLHFPRCAEALDVYRHHVDYWISSLRAAYPDGLIVWRAVQLPQYDPNIPFQTRPTGCATAENVSRLDAGVRATLHRHRLHVVEAPPGNANATPDTIHYDGGVLRSYHANSSYHAKGDAALWRQVHDQTVSNASLAALLAVLRHEFDTRRHPADGSSEAVVKGREAPT